MGKTARTPTLHCNRDLFIARPLLDRIQAVTERLTTLEKNHAQMLKTAVDGTGSNPLAFAVNAAATIDRQVPLLSPFSALALTFILLVAAHFLIIVELDLSLLYLRIVSIVVPAIFGFLYREAGYGLLADFAAG